MHGIFNLGKLRSATARLELPRLPPPAKRDRSEAALETAQLRITELTNALQGLVDLSDTSKTRDFADVKRRLAHAQGLLAVPFQLLSPDTASSAPDGDEEHLGVGTLKKVLEVSWGA